MPGHQWWYRAPLPPQPGASKAPASCLVYCSCALDSFSAESTQKRHIAADTLKYRRILIVAKQGDPQRGGVFRRASGDKGAQSACRATRSSILALYLRLCSSSSPCRNLAKVARKPSAMGGCRGVPRRPSCEPVADRTWRPSTRRTAATRARCSTSPTKSVGSVRWRTRSARPSLSRGPNALSLHLGQPQAARSFRRVSF